MLSSTREASLHVATAGAAMMAPAAVAAELGRTGLAPFVVGPDAHLVRLLDGAALASYVRKRRWAVTPGDVLARPGDASHALRAYLDVVAAQRLDALVVGTAEPDLFRREGFIVEEIADEAVVDLSRFDLAGRARANVRHSVSAGRRKGLSVCAYRPGDRSQLREVSDDWLKAKRGGELGFTLSRVEDVAGQVAEGHTDAWVVTDQDGRMQAWCTWRHYDRGTARVLDLMRRRASAPGPAMDLLLAECLSHYRGIGVTRASLSGVPRSQGALAERVYPTASLRAYKEKFAPTWETRWLAFKADHGAVTPRRLSALLAVASAYSPGGIARSLRRNR